MNGLLWKRADLLIVHAARGAGPGMDWCLKLHAQWPPTCSPKMQRLLIQIYAHAFMTSPCMAHQCKPFAMSPHQQMGNIVRRRWKIWQPASKIETVQSGMQRWLLQMLSAGHTSWELQKEETSSWTNINQEGFDQIKPYQNAQAGLRGLVSWRCDPL